MDVRGCHSAEEIETALHDLDQEGVINPSATTGKYEPDRDMTRAEFMRYVNRAFHFTEKASISSRSEAIHKDDTISGK